MRFVSRMEEVLHTAMSDYVFGKEGNRMVIKEVTLKLVCGLRVHFRNDKSGNCVAGKSNVGKSSLINALMNRKSLCPDFRDAGKDLDDQLYNINREIYLVSSGLWIRQGFEKEKEAMGKMIERYLP